MDRLDLVVETLQHMNLKVDRRRLLQGGLFAGLNLTVLARLASQPVAPVEGCRQYGHNVGISTDR